MPTFTGPVVYDVPRFLPETRGVARLVMRHYSPLPRGRTVIKVAGVYSTVDNPPQSLLDTATEIYLGGHEYEVSQTVADALTAAGYTTTASPVDSSSTWAGMATRTWGEVAGYTWGRTP